MKVFYLTTPVVPRSRFPDGAMCLPTCLLKLISQPTLGNYFITTKRLVFRNSRPVNDRSRGTLFQSNTSVDRNVKQWNPVIQQRASCNIHVNCHQSLAGRLRPISSLAAGVPRCPVWLGHPGKYGLIFYSDKQLFVIVVTQPLGLAFGQN